VSEDAPGRPQTTARASRQTRSTLGRRGLQPLKALPSTARDVRGRLLLELGGRGLLGGAPRGPIDALGERWALQEAVGAIQQAFQGEIEDFCGGPAELHRGFFSRGNQLAWRSSLAVRTLLGKTSA